MAGRVAIVCALPQELGPLVKRWRKVRERGLTFFESEKAVAVAGGIGTAPAALASMTLIAREQPGCLVSAGLCGALRADLKVGTVLMPRTVINVATGKRFSSASSETEGSLVSGRTIAGEEQKRALREQFQADGLDMEAAGVASIADSCGLPFYAVKAVSDELDFVMPPMNDFVDPEGKLRMANYAVQLVVHPSWWGPTWRLARNGHLAALELCRVLEHQIEQFRKIEQGALKPQA